MRTPRKVTPRGFSDFAELRDTRGSLINIRRSSAAMEPCVWIFCKDGKNPLGTEDPHLNIVQAMQVINALRAFVREAAKEINADAEAGK